MDFYFLGFEKSEIHKIEMVSLFTIVSFILNNLNNIFRINYVYICKKEKGITVLQRKL